jgi:hypothetical protein
VVTRRVQQIDRHLRDPLHRPENTGQLEPRVHAGKRTVRRNHSLIASELLFDFPAPYDRRLWTEEWNGRMKAEG